jgi:hypothetical protein
MVWGTHTGGGAATHSRLQFGGLEQLFCFGEVAEGDYKGVRPLLNPSVTKKRLKPTSLVTPHPSNGLTPCPPRRAQVRHPPLPPIYSIV